LAFKPSTNIDKYKKLIKHCDYITIMGVNPGFGGQKFLSETIDNLKKIYCFKKEINPNLIIQLDGGVNFDVMKVTAKYVDHFISGSFLFKYPHSKKEIVEFVNNL